MFRIILISFAILFLHCFGFSQNNLLPDHLEGSWLGKLSVQSFELRIVFRFTKDSTGVIQTYLDSPDQGAKDIPASISKISGDSLYIQVKSIMATYETRLMNDSILQGTFKQAGMKFPLELTKQKVSFKLNRPQEPRPPFPYEIKEVEFSNPLNGNVISGTLTYPNDKTGIPGVILISGSGPQNRDEEILGHKPFLVIADFLSRNGIAVLRYDDRGTGKSTGSFADANSFDFADDAKAAFHFFKKQLMIDSTKIGLMGHSEGGMIAQIIAAGNPEIDFLVFLAAPGQKGDELLLLQSELINRASGQSEKEIRQATKTNQKIYSIVQKEKDPELAKTKIYKELIRFQSGFSKDEIEKSGFTEEYIQASINQITSNWFATFLNYDPVIYLKEIKCPVLALNGSLDLQVDANENLRIIEQTLLLSGNPDVEVKEIDGLNHLFQPAKTGLPGEYNQIEITFDQSTLDMILAFIKSIN